MISLHIYLRQIRYQISLYPISLTVIYCITDPLFTKIHRILGSYFLRYKPRQTKLSTLNASFLNELAQQRKCARRRNNDPRL